MVAGLHLGPGAGAAVMDSRMLEINLISAQGLKPPSAAFRPTPAFYAVAWLDPALKLRTHLDRSGGPDPTWNDRFIFRIPAALLAADSPAAISVDIYASGGWCLPDALAGSVRILLGNHRLLHQPRGAPSFAAAGVRRPSGRLHGVLNFAATILTRVSLLAAEALAASPAVAYRDLMEESPRAMRRTATLPPPLPRAPPEKEAAAALREWDGGKMNRSDSGEIKWEERSDGGGPFCGLGAFNRRIHLSPSDPDLQMYGGGFNSKIHLSPSDPDLRMYTAHSNGKASS